MEAGEGSKSLLQWIKSFDDISRTCDSWTDLADGVILSELIQQICPACLDDALIEQFGDLDEVTRESNLRCVASAIAEFYNEIHEQMVPVERLDFAAMAQQTGEGAMHLRFLVEILLASAIQCEDKEIYIRKIMNDLDHEAQAAIMSIVTNVVSSESLSPASTPASSVRKLPRLTLDSPRAEDSDEDGDYAVSHHTSQALLTLKLEKEHFENKAKELEDQNATIALELEEARKFLAQTRRTNKDYLESKKVQDMERQKSFTTEMAKRENDLQGQLREMTMNLKERTDALANQARLFQQRERQLKTQIQGQMDELDILRSNAMMSKRQQQQLERYKAAVEDIPNLKRQRHELEKKNTEYLNKMLDMEGKLASIPSLENDLQTSTEKLLAASSQQNKLQLVLGEKETQLRHIQGQLDRAKQEVVQLEEAASEALTDRSFEGENLAMERGLDLSILEADRSPKPSLKEANARLERQVAQLQRDLAAAKAATSGAPTDSSNSKKFQKLSQDHAASLQTIAKLKKALKNNKSRSVSSAASPPAASSVSNDKFERVKAIALKQKKVLATKTAKITEYEEYIVMLKEKLNSKQGELNTRLMEQRKLEKYVSKAMVQSKKCVKETQEACVKKVKSFESQRDEAQEEARALKTKLGTVNQSRRKEQRLMMSAFYHMGTDLCRHYGKTASSIADAPTPSQSWLGQRRARLRTPTHRR